MIDSYITVSETSWQETVINKSRFIGCASPCTSEDEALSFLQQIREKYKSASHYCYAYIIGENKGIMRYSDDGEPGGTAGLPMMDVLRSKDIVNCCVVVVRYFGGILLGTGGLVRAYTSSCQAAVNAAGIVSMELTTEEYCELPYSVWDKFRYAADRSPVIINRIEYGASVSFHLFCRSKEVGTVIPGLSEAADRRLETLMISESFFPWKAK